MWTLIIQSGNARATVIAPTSICPANAATAAPIKTISLTGIGADVASTAPAIAIVRMAGPVPISGAEASVRILASKSRHGIPIGERRQRRFRGIMWSRVDHPHQFRRQICNRSEAQKHGNNTRCNQNGDRPDHGTLAFHQVTADHDLVVVSESDRYRVIALGEPADEFNRLLECILNPICQKDIAYVRACTGYRKRAAVDDIPGRARIRTETKDRRKTCTPEPACDG